MHVWLDPVIRIFLEMLKLNFAISETKYLDFWDGRTRELRHHSQNGVEQGLPPMFYVRALTTSLLAFLGQSSLSLLLKLVRFV